MTKNKKSAFTLIEIMVTLFILMILAILISTGLNSVLKTEERIKLRRLILTETQAALLQMGRDMHQVINLPVLDNKGKALPTFIISNNSIEFTRAQMIDPLDIKKTQLQRITYRLVGTDLLRSSRNISKTTTMNSDSQILLKNVTLFNCYLIPKNSPLSKSDTKKSEDSQQKEIRMGVVIVINTKDLGYMKRAIPFPFNTIAQDPNASS